MKSTFFSKKRRVLNSVWDRIVLSFLKDFYKVFSKIFLTKVSLVLIIIFGINFNAIHANDTIQVKVWIDYIEENDSLFVKGLMANLNEDPQKLNWEMKVENYSIPDSSKTIKGEVTAEFFLPILAVETNVDLKKKEYFEIIFSVFDSTMEVLDSDTLKISSIDPEVKKPPPPTPVIAKRALPRPGVSNDAIEIDGLILDETRSKIGRDFYETFYNRWTPPMGAKDFSIIIKELPPRGIGARVSIHVNDNLVLFRFLQPRGEVVEQEANISISYVKRYLMQNENIKQDMESGDQLGSGIF